MTRKRRIFDIDLPEEELDTASAPQEAAEGPRKGPMATAITENAEALQARQSAAEAIRSENDALAHEYVQLRAQGQVIRSIPLDQVQTRLLVRDRIQGEDQELADLVTSIRDVGLSNPIRVIERPHGEGVELIQGSRRLAAYRQLLAETGDDTWAAIPALVLPGSPDVAGLYRRMVDENVVRKDLSFAEMAHAAKAYAEDPQTDATTLADAVAALFQSAPYSKRSYIRSFAELLETLGETLNYPTEIPRRLGVDLARILKADPGVVHRIKADLTDWDNRSVADELEVLQRHAGATKGDVVAEKPTKVAAKPAGQGGRTKTTFHMRSRAGQVKCVAADGRLEIKVNRDFSAIDRKQLALAISSLIDGLG